MLGEKSVAEQCSTLEKLIDASGIGAVQVELEQLETTMRELLRRYAEIG